MLRVAVGCAFALAQGLLGQEYEWVAVPGATGGPFSNAYLVDDAPRGSVLAFGQVAPFEIACPPAGGWGTWSLRSGVWAQVASLIAPNGRVGHSMACDTNRGRLVLFGGRAQPSSASSMQDTWEWDGTAWLPFPFAVPPQARHGHVMAFDVTRSLCLMHGGVVGGMPSGETWAWNGSVWILLASNGPTGCDSMAFHQGIGKAIAVGNGATWLWDGLAWVSSGAHPASVGVVWDDGRQNVLLIGPPSGSPSSSVWTWDQNASLWQPIAMRALVYQPMAERVAYDRSLGRPIIRTRQIACTGTGLTPGVLYPIYSLQQYVPPRVVASATSVGSGCGLAPLTLTQDAVLRPIIGSSSALDVSNAPLAFAYLAIGTRSDSLNSYTLPLALDSLGLSGCFLRQNMDYEGAYPTAATGASSTRATIPIPNDPVLLRQRIHFQAWAFAPGANPAGITVSNMISWFIGEV